MADARWCSRFQGFSTKKKKLTPHQHTHALQDVAEGLFYMDQTIGNACGTIGLLHAIANNTDTIALGDGFLKTFIEETKTLSPEERGAKLEGNEGITEAHEVSAQVSSTKFRLRIARIAIQMV